MYKINTRVCIVLNLLQWLFYAMHMKVKREIYIYIYINYEILLKIKKKERK